MILIVSSRKDTAGLNIKRQVLKNYPFNETEETYQENPVFYTKLQGAEVKLITLNEESIKAQYLSDHFHNLSLVVFISRHSSQSGTPTLSVHTPGNFGPAELGGLPRCVSISPATAMRDTLAALLRYRAVSSAEYEVCYECTHHGPSLNAPTMFVELGSSPPQWSDMDAAETVAHATMDAISKFGRTQNSAALGIGGTHYNQRFTRMALEGKAIFSHMIPKYAVGYADSEILSQCVEKTVEKVDCALLDWKGIRSENKENLISSLQEIRLPYVKI
jgi:D-aminoacyl-tRNA deacylase